jgi:hypothetical protein
VGAGVSPNPSDFLGHLRREGYHSRSNKHSNALADAIVDDLVRTCPVIREKGMAGGLVFWKNFKLRAGTADWNVDLVFGPPPPDSGSEVGPRGIGERVPVAVEIAIELKAVMTAHRKAVKNRKRDLEAHHEHVHNYNERAVAGGVLIVNGSPTFQSPLEDELSTHRNPERLIEHCVNEMRAVATRGGPTGYGLEAKCVIVVSMDNVNYPKAGYIDRPPAPQIGDPLHYDAFIRALCETYRSRFGA